MQLSDFNHVTSTSHVQAGYLYLFGNSSSNEYCLSFAVRDEDTQEIRLIDVASYYNAGKEKYPHDQKVGSFAYGSDRFVLRINGGHTCYEIGPFNLLIDFEKKFLAQLPELGIN